MSNGVLIVQENGISRSVGVSEQLRLSNEYLIWAIENPPEGSPVITTFEIGSVEAANNLAPDLFVHTADMHFKFKHRGVTDKNCKNRQLIILPDVAGTSHIEGIEEIETLS